MKLNRGLIRHCRRFMAALILAILVLLSIGTLVLWARSHAFIDHASWAVKQHFYVHFCSDGPGEFCLSMADSSPLDQTMNVHSYALGVMPSISPAERERAEVWEFYDPPHEPELPRFYASRIFLIAGSQAAPPRLAPTLPPGTPRGWWLRAPAWFVFVLFSVIPSAVGAGVFIRWLWARLRRTPGLCAKCCYDLRAHRPGDKCPECGTAVPAAVKP